MDHLQEREDEDVVHGVRDFGVTGKFAGVGDSVEGGNWEVGADDTGAGRGDAGDVRAVG